MRCRSLAATHVGQVREHNEDAYASDGENGLHVVADGMGGHAFGEVASAVTVETVRRHVASRAADLRAGAGGPDVPGRVRRVLEEALRAAGRAVWKQGQDDPAKRGMGSTCSALLVSGERAVVAHVGDSRVYVVRDGRAVQLTRDHTVLAEMLESGEIEGADALAASGFGGALVRAMGVCPEVEVDAFEVEAVPGDVFVLCSDGLTRHVGPDTIAQLATARRAEAAQDLVDLANERGGQDNVTVVVVAVEGAGAAADDARARELARKVEAFRRIPLFRHLDDGQLFRVLAATEAKECDAGTVVLREGEPGAAVYVVLSGEVRIEKGGVPVADLGPGAHFGELAVLDGAPRSATAVMTSRGRLLRLRREHVGDLVDRSPEIAVRILWSFAGTLSERLRATTDALQRARGAGHG